MAAMDIGDPLDRDIEELRHLILEKPLERRSWSEQRELILKSEKLKANDLVVLMCMEALTRFRQLPRARILVGRVSFRVGEHRLASDALLPIPHEVDDPGVFMLAARAHAASDRLPEAIEAAFLAWKIETSNTKPRIFLFNHLRRLASDHVRRREIVDLAWAEIHQSSGGDFATASSALSLLRSLQEIDSQRLEALLTERAKWDSHPRWLFEIAMMRGDRRSALLTVEKALGAGWDPSGDVTLARQAIEMLLGGGDIGAHKNLLDEARTYATSDPTLGRRLQQIDSLLGQYGCSRLWIEGEQQSITTLGLVTRSLLDGRPSAPTIDVEPGDKKVMFLGGSLAAGGAEKIMSKVFNSLRQSGGSVELCLMNLPDEESHSDKRLFYLDATGLQFSEIKKISAGDNEVTDFFAPLGRFAALRVQGLYEILRRERPAVLHCWLDYANIVGGLAGIAAGVPHIIFHCHNMRPGTLQVDAFSQAGWAEFYHLMLGRPEVTFVNCSFAGAADYLSWVGRTGISSVVIPNGFDFAPFDHLLSLAERGDLREEIGIPRDVKVVGTALRFTPVKRPIRWFEMAIDVMRKREDVHVVMFGDGEMLEEVSRLRSKSDFQDRIHLPGLCSDIHRKLQALDVFVLSSISEGLPNVLIEAQACGVPVVSYDVGGVAETMIDGVTGTLVREDSAAALATSALQWIDGRSRVEAKIAAINHVRNSFSLGLMMNKIRELYRRKN